MTSVSPVLVLKFGGASLASAESFAHVAKIISSRRKSGFRVVTVVSAMAGVTDQLIDLARKVSEIPPPRELDMLVSAGERVSMSLLAMALAKLGKPAASFTGSQSGIITTSDHHNAKILEVRAYRLLPYLERNDIVIVAGFQGVSREKEVTTLGRGGSDTTAVALAAALGAKGVEFYKDVAGVHARDPKQTGLKSAPFESLTYEEALDVISKEGKAVIHPRALELAAKQSVPLCVRSFQTFFDEKGFEGTWISYKKGIGRKQPIAYEQPSCQKTG